MDEKKAERVSCRLRRLAVIFFPLFFLYSRTNSNSVADIIMYLFGNSSGIDYDICNPFILPNGFWKNDGINQLYAAYA